MPPEPQPVKAPSTPVSGQLSSGRRTPESTDSTVPSTDDFLSSTEAFLRQVQSTTQQVIEVVSDPRTLPLARVSVENPELAVLIVRLGTSSERVNIQNLNRDELDLIVNNIGLLQESGLLDAIRNDINDPRLEAFLRLRARDSTLADSLAHLFVRAITTENFGVNDITTDEILLISNNIELIRETGFLDAIRSDLPAGARQAIEFSEDHPALFQTCLVLGNTCPFLVDFGKSVIDNPVRGYVAAGTTAIGAIGFGILCFCKLSFVPALLALFPAVIIGALIGFGIGLLLSKLF